jgi:hypothetical protein
MQRQLSACSKVVILGAYSSFGVPIYSFIDVGWYLCQRATAYTVELCFCVEGDSSRELLFFSECKPAVDGGSMHIMATCMMMQGMTI